MKNFDVFLRSNEIRKTEEETGKKKLGKVLSYIVFGMIIGAINGFFGAGGGMLAVPVLSFVGGLGEKKAHATAIAVMLPLCIVSVVVYGVGKAIDLAVTIPTSIGVLFGGIIGAKLLKKLPETAVFFVFNLIMLIAGLKMLF